MKLVCDLFQEVVEIKEGEPVFLTIEKPEILYKLIKAIFSEINGGEEGVVFSEDGVILKASKKVELITTFVPFDLNEKRLLNKINSLLENEAMNEEHFDGSMKLLAEIENYVIKISDLFGFDVVLENLSMASLFKMCGIKISDDSCSEIERIWNYVSFVDELLGEKLFVFVNICSFFEEKEIQELVDNINNHKAMVLFIENKDNSVINGAKRLIIDKDLCII